MGKYLEAEVIKVKAEKSGAIFRRTDFTYLGGHGTFYQFDAHHFP